MSRNIKVLIADDHKIVRNGIIALLENVKGIKVIAEAEDGNEALKLVKRLKPDVLLTDINMPIMNGIDLTERIVNSGLSTKVLILSMYNEEPYILKAVEAGVMGYLPKDAEYDEIVKGIRALANDQLYYNADITKIITNSIVRSSHIKHELSKFEHLTKREEEVLRNIVKGDNNKEIGDSLFISSRTVDTHRTNIMRKLNARNTADLVRKSIENNLI